MSKPETGCEQPGPAAGTAHRKQQLGDTPPGPRRRGCGHSSRREARPSPPPEPVPLTPGAGRGSAWRGRTHAHVLGTRLCAGLERTGARCLQTGSRRPSCSRKASLGPMSEGHITPALAEDGPGVGEDGPLGAECAQHRPGNRAATHGCRHLSGAPRTFSRSGHATGTPPTLSSSRPSRNMLLSPGQLLRGQALGRGRGPATIRAGETHDRARGRPPEPGATGHHEGGSTRCL